MENKAERKWPVTKCRNIKGEMAKTIEEMAEDINDEEYIPLISLKLSKQSTNLPVVNPESTT